MDVSVLLCLLDVLKVHTESGKQVQFVHQRN